MRKAKINMINTNTTPKQPDARVPIPEKSTNVIEKDLPSGTAVPLPHINLDPHSVESDSTITYNLDTLLAKDLHELETLLRTTESTPKSLQRTMRLRGLRASIIQRQHNIKSKAMEFEQDNDRHLLIFDSTYGYSKIAGNSVLFYTNFIADRINRRYNLKIDTDRYSKSENGVISLKLNPELIAQLAKIHIYPDRFLSTTELHFFHLDNIYTPEQIETLRDQKSHDASQAINALLPKAPTPLLNDAIMRINQTLYQACKRTTDFLARESYLIPLLSRAHEMALYYVAYANASKTSKKLHNLRKIYENTLFLKNSLSNLYNLDLIHARHINELITSLIEVERLSTKLYNELRTRTAD